MVTSLFPQMSTLIRFAIVFACASLASWSSASGMAWYKDNIVPSKHSPPGFVFGLVWTFIYVTFAFVWSQEVQTGGTRTDFIYGVSLFLNVLWVLVFFTGHAIQPSIGIIVSLLAVVLFQAYDMWFHSKSDYPGLYTFLLLVYASWLICATGLNIETYFNNADNYRVIQ